MQMIYILLIPMMLQLGKPDYEAFKTKFPSFKWDENGNHLTRPLNAKSYIDLRNQYSSLTEAENYYYACNQDSSRLYLEYDLYHMEEGYLIERVKKQYKRYAVLSLETERYDLLMHAKHDDDDNRFFYLQSYSKSGDLLDEMEVNQRIYEYAPVEPFYQYILMQKKGFKLFAYSRNSVEGEDPTKVVISDYSIDDLGKFNFVSKDSVFLKNRMGKYANFDTEPWQDDPIYKYWTLW